MPTRDPVAAYLDEVVARVRAIAGEALAGVWLFGSAAAGGFADARSDLDVQAVTEGELPRSVREELARALDHGRLPVPVRGLEFVVYARGRIPVPQLNLNTGPRMSPRLDLEPDPAEAFWFVLDVAIGREAGRALYGPPAREVFPPLPREQIVSALLALLERDETPQAAARAWAWAADGRWRSKAEAQRWATQRAAPGEFAALARQALTQPGRPRP